MKTRMNIIFSIFLTTLILIACDDSGSEDTPMGSIDNTPTQTTLDGDYRGVLSLVFARSCPSFSVTIEIEIDVYKSGDVLMSQPSSATYGKEQECMPGIEKEYDRGTIFVTSLDGYAVEIEGKKYIQITKNTLITGTQTLWRSEDNGLTWIQMLETDYEYENIAANPLNFELDEAVLPGATIGGSIGIATYEWKLMLLPIP